jgi:hypothetical protein
MTKEELFQKITDWEIDKGESFNDYFSHSNISNQSWLFWLLGKGYIEHANRIIDEILKGEKCIDQVLLYDVYTEDDALDWEEALDKNTKLMAEFLTSTPYYTNKVTEFFNDEEND